MVETAQFLAEEELVDEGAIAQRKGVRWALRKFAKNRSGVVGAVILLLLIVATVLGRSILPYDPFRLDMGHRLLPPNAQHWFGTDELGRDLLSRVVFGSRYFLMVGAYSTSVAATFGVALGLLASAGGAVADTILMRLVDIMLAFPYILLLLAIIAMLGPSLSTAMFAVGVAGIPGYARLVRGEALSVREREYVEAMRVLGASRLRITLGTVLPNILPSIVIYVSYSMPLAVLSASALSFLGLGAQPPLPEWGAMLVSSRTFISTAWWVVAAPGMAIFVAILGMNLFGNGLRDVLDPKEA